MKRNTAREIAVQIIFGEKFDSFPVDEFLNDENRSMLSLDCDLYSENLGKQKDYIRSVVCAYSDHAEEIDGYIKQFSSGWDIRRISGTALAVLRCAIAEILYIEDVPTAVAINSAVEIDKKYDDSETVSFVNGVLGSFVRAVNIE